MGVQSIFDDFPVPSSARLLGWEVRAIDPAAQTIEIGFVLDDRFLNPAGNVQGGFLAAMLDDTQGPALFSASGGTVYAPTIDFHIVCLKPARPGHFTGKARVISLGKTIAVTEAELFDEGGALVARGTFTSRVMESAMARRGQQ
ncbi:PaaI family thioesterase [Sphingomonas sp. JC676]|uniref:PaaI family thioesterase n=1 Tax=Sphingomonas sp. JC676 TaxID=2768065 RepID=UPI00165823EC|nr:PaaI family thioesterase [Sphingomonas sp. JC676]MBC9033320.1 PaaI family thioesterase [Sphingomonas sp. JC676]